MATIMRRRARRPESGARHSALGRQRIPRSPGLPAVSAGPATSASGRTTPAHARPGRRAAGRPRRRPSRRGRWRCYGVRYVVVGRSSARTTGMLGVAKWTPAARSTAAPRRRTWPRPPGPAAPAPSGPRYAAARQVKPRAAGPVKFMVAPREPAYHPADEDRAAVAHPPTRKERREAEPPSRRPNRRRGPPPWRHGVGVGVDRRAWVEVRGGTGRSRSNDARDGNSAVGAAG